MTRRMTIAHDSDLTHAVLKGDLADLRVLEERKGEDVVVLTLEEWSTRNRKLFAMLDRVSDGLGVEPYHDHAGLIEEARAAVRGMSALLETS